MGAGIAPVFVVVAVTTASPPMVPVLAFGVLVVAAAALGLFVHGRSQPPTLRAGWSMLAAGLGFHVVSGMVRAGSATPSGLSAIADIAVLAGSACSLAGVVRLLRHRLGTGTAQVIGEAGMGAAAAGVVALALAPGGSAGNPAGEAFALVVPALDLFVLWLAVRLVWLTNEHPTAYRYLIGAFFCLLTADAVTTGFLLTPSAAAVPRLNAIELYSYGLWGVAALHPSLRVPFQPVVERTGELRWPQVTLLLAVALAGPVALAVQGGRGETAAVPVVLIGSALLPVLVVVHLVRQVRGRAKAEYLGRHDALTGLPNRVLFHDRLDVALTQARRSGSRTAVMFLDLDRFKSVNDSLGHAAGNHLLEAAARRLRACLRESDTVARLGGDEFAMLLPSVATPGDAIAVAEKVRQAFQEPLVTVGRELFSTTSIGVALFPDDGDDVETLLRNADTAMYRAKTNGRNRYQRYTSDMSARAAVKLSLESSLRRALERDELVVHYQPKVHLREGNVVGLEALARWPHPRLGHVPPSAFISLAEETGLILPLGEWVLEAACRQSAAWRERGLLAVPVAVNVSARQFAQQRVEDLVAGVLSRTGVAPSLLEVEITESVFMHDVRAVNESLHRLQSMGVRCSIDDFGTGYSGLHYLARMPIDSLKIDRSFVQRIGIDDHEEAIIEAIIALSHTLDLNVIAEGVETEEQMAFLRSRGCEQMQGYLFSRPLPADGLEHLLTIDRAAPWSSPDPLVEANRSSSSHVSLPGIALGGADARPSHRHAPELSCLLDLLCRDEDLGTLDHEAVPALLAALRFDECVAAAGPSRQRTVSVRIAAGTVAGLMPLSGSMAAAGALPGRAQQIASHVLGQIGVEVPAPTVSESSEPVVAAPPRTGHDSLPVDATGLIDSSPAAVAEPVSPAMPFLPPLAMPRPNPPADLPGREKSPAAPPAQPDLPVAPPGLGRSLAPPPAPPSQPVDRPTRPNPPVAPPGRGTSPVPPQAEPDLPVAPPAQDTPGPADPPASRPPVKSMPAGHPLR